MLRKKWGMSNFGIQLAGLQVGKVCVCASLPYPYHNPYIQRLTLACCEAAEGKEAESRRALVLSRG